MISVYIDKKLDYSLVPLLFPNFGIGKKTDLFLQCDKIYYQNEFVRISKDIDKADFILLPHNYESVLKIKGYLEHYFNLSKKHKKKIIIFNYGDYTGKIDIPASIIMRPSQYRFKKEKNEIIMPAIVDDFFILKGKITPRRKSTKPIVGFCGWARYNNKIHKLKHFAKNTFFDLKSIIFFNNNIKAYKKGIYYRKKAITNLEKSGKIKTNFIVRNTFSAHSKTINLPIEQARAEYINNIINSDFNLAIKGDGNFSLRFFEILSAGRIPLLIDTCCVLPLEEIIDYRKFVLKVDFRKLADLESITSSFYDSLDNDEFIAMQEKARRTFETYLRIDKYFNYLFKEEKIRELIK